MTTPPHGDLRKLPFDRSISVHNSILTNALFKTVGVLLWRFRLFSGFWGQVQAAAVEVDGVNEVALIAEAPSGVLDPLDLGVDGFAARVRDPMPQIRDDIF